MLNTPFLQAGASRALNSNLLKTSKFSLTGVLTNLEKTVSTINQVVPLYNQVKPLITNSKTILNAFKSTTKSNKENIMSKSENIVNVNYKEMPLKQNNEETTFNNFFTNVTGPNKPFFN